MKKILVMLLVFCGLSFSQTLKFVTSPDYPPFSYMKDGKYTGVDMEILDNVAKRAGFDYEIVQTSFERIGGELDLGADFAISSITKTAERSAKFDFSDKYYEVTQLFIAEQGNDFISKDSLIGKKIGVINSKSVQERLAQSIPDAEVIVAGSLVNLIVVAKTGKVDAIIVESTNAPSVLFNDYENVSEKDKMGLDMLRELNLGKKLEIFHIENSDDGEFCIITKKGTHAGELAKINSALESMKNDGTIAKILAKYKVK